MKKWQMYAISLLTIISCASNTQTMNGYIIGKSQVGAIYRFKIAPSYNTRSDTSNIVSFTGSKEELSLLRKNFDLGDFVEIKGLPSGSLSKIERALTTNKITKTTPSSDL